MPSYRSPRSWYNGGRDWTQPGPHLFWLLDDEMKFMGLKVTFLT